MARYIKANHLVAKHLNLQNDRLMVNDGNYILWQADMLEFGPLTNLSAILESIGAIALMPHEAREEQDGINLRSLPTATDPRFIIPTPAPDEFETPVEAIEDESTDGPVKQPEDDMSGEILRTKDDSEVDESDDAPEIMTIK